MSSRESRKLKINKDHHSVHSSDNTLHSSGKAADEQSWALCIVLNPIVENRGIRDKHVEMTGAAESR